jgi:tetratricopeptide (TPR) repeat protein
VAGFSASRRTWRPPIRVGGTSPGDQPEAERAHAPEQIGVSALPRAGFGLREGVELEAARDVVGEDAELLPGAVGRVGPGRDDVERELPLQLCDVLAPRRAESFAGLSEVYEGLRDWDGVVSTLTSVLTLVADEDSSEAKAYGERLARAYGTRGQLADAITVRRGIVQAAPSDAGAHIGLAQLLEQRGDWTEAYREYQSATRLASRQASWVHAGAGDAYARHDLLPEAAAAYHQALELDPRQEWVRTRLLEVERRRGQTERTPEPTPRPKLAGS